jgi:hypothetical protein
LIREPFVADVRANQWREALMQLAVSYRAGNSGSDRQRVMSTAKYATLPSGPS